MELSYYQNLADRLPKDEIIMLFSDLIKTFKQREIKLINFLEIMVEITERQVYTYEFLEKNMRNEIDNIIYGVWNTENFDEVDMILFIITNLGLKKSFIKIKESIEKSEGISQKISVEIRETIEEIGTISDSYDTYFKYNKK